MTTSCQGDEREARSQLQEERFQVLDQGIFQLALAVFVLEIQELQQVRIADHVFDGNVILRPGFLAAREHCRLLLGMRRPFEELRADLPVELPHRPAAANGFAFIERAGVRFLDR